MRDEVLCLREKVKTRLNDSDHYRKFLSCIVHYSTGNITQSNLENLVNDILGAYPDLMEEVNGFIDRSESAGSLWSGNLPGYVKADDEDQDRERDIKNVSVIKDEYQAKPIHELDLSDVNNVVQVKICPKNSYKLDMLIGSAKAAAKSVEELLKKINNKFFKTDSDIIFEEHLSGALNVYMNGLDVLDVLKKNASLALSVILIILKQKQEDWERCRFDVNKIWADIYAKNHHKSLDHRSFYFKQQDSKSLSAKG
ncbi:paired amphipathic helix protein Sin3-like protein 4 isoform X2 [Tanacetum coccineum]